MILRYEISRPSLSSHNQPVFVYFSVIGQLWGIWISFRLWINESISGKKHFQFPSLRIKLFFIRLDYTSSSLLMQIMMNGQNINKANACTHKRMLSRKLPIQKSFISIDRYRNMRPRLYKSFWRINMFAFSYFYLSCAFSNVWKVWSFIVNKNESRELIMLKGVKQFYMFL